VRSGDIVPVRQPRHRLQPSVWRKLFGWGCVLVGLLGLILPIIPGIPLLFIGITALATQHHWAHNLLVWMKARFQAFREEHRRRATRKAAQSPACSPFDPREGT